MAAAQPTLTSPDSWDENDSATSSSSSSSIADSHAWTPEEEEEEKEDWEGGKNLFVIVRYNPWIKMFILVSWNESHGIMRDCMINEKIKCEFVKCFTVYCNLQNLILIFPVLKFENTQYLSICDVMCENGKSPSKVTIQYDDYLSDDKQPLCLSLFYSGSMIAITGSSTGSVKLSRPSNWYDKKWLTLTPFIWIFLNYMSTYVLSSVIFLTFVIWAQSLHDC